MGGFALALSSAGDAAQKYSQQMRQILEQRRGLLGQLWAQQASVEEDPDTRAAYLQHSIDAYNGKPMGALIQDASKTVSKKAKDNQALQNGIGTLAQHVQTQATPPPPPPGVTQIGKVAGTSSNALAGSAAQPNTNPLTQTSGQIQPIPNAQATANPTSQVQPIPNAAASDNSTPQPIPNATYPLLGALAQSPPDIQPVADVNQFPTPPDISAAPWVPPVSIPGTMPDANTTSSTGATLPIISSTGGSLSSVSGLPVPETQDQIDAYFNSIPAWHTPHGQERLQGAYNARLAHAETLRNTLEAQQATLAYKQAGLKTLKESGQLDKLPAQAQAQFVAEAYGLPAPPLAAGLYEPRMLSSGTLGEDAPPGTLEYGTNSPVRKGVRYAVRQIPLTGQTIWQPEVAQTLETQTPDGGLQLVNRANGNKISDIANGVSPGWNSLRGIGVTSNGQNELSSPWYIAHHLPPLMGALNPSFIPSTSTVTTPGAPSQTTRRVKGNGVASLPLPSGAPLAPSTTSGGGTPPVGGAGPKPAEFNDPLAKANYDNYMAGKGGTLSPKEMSGVRLYAATHDKPMPDVLNGAGQKTIATLDPVLQQINDLLPRLNGIKGKSLITDYQKYQQGFATPYDDLFTGIAFERLRSGSAALQGIGSRSYPVFSEGLKHTPTFDRLHGFNPDSVNLMIDKLTEAKKIIQEERASAVYDQKKSGVVPSIDASGGLTPPPTSSAVNDLINKYK